MASNVVNVFEVGPRDGLQNEPTVLSLKDKIRFISDLLNSGIKDFEAGAFVRPDRVPQMHDTDELCRILLKENYQSNKKNAWFLVPNRKGLERAFQSGATRIAVFTAATETFAQKNIGMSIQASLDEFKEVISMGKSLMGSKLKVRGYVSTAFGCPFEGKVNPKKAIQVIQKLAELDVQQISIGDTIGVASPKNVTDVVGPSIQILGKKTAVHFHDTRGTALANTLRALDLGVRTIDSSAGGLGGCPFAPGAAGNLATEDLVYMLNGMGIKTGIDLERLCKASLEIYKKLKRPIASRYLQTYFSKCK